MLTIQNVFTTLFSFYPSEMQPQIQKAMPEILAAALQLAAEVLRAETMGLSYAQAARRPGFSLLARVQFGLVDLLRMRIPKPIRPTIEAVLARAQKGDFDPFRRSLFHTASKREDPEAALVRFLFYQGARLNLLVATWYLPEAEALGSLRRMDTEAQRVLNELLDEPLLYGEDVRPLHLFVSEMMLRLEQDADVAMDKRLEEAKQTISFIDALSSRIGESRSLNAADGAILANEIAAALGEERLGDRQMAERHPHLFRSHHAVAKRAWRLTRGARGGTVTKSQPGDRFVDMLCEAPKEVE